MRGLHSYTDQISYGQLVILDPSVALCPAEFRRKNVQRCKKCKREFGPKRCKSQVKRTTTAMTPRLGQPLFLDRKCACLQMEKVDAESVVSARARGREHFVDVHNLEHWI